MSKLLLIINFGLIDVFNTPFYISNYVIFFSDLKKKIIDKTFFIEDC